MDKIIPAVETTLFDPTLREACSNIVELGIDSLLDDSLFRSIPVVSVLIGVGKTAQNIHDRNLLKQTLKFISAFNENKIPDDKLYKYKKKFEDNPKFVEEELGRVIILLNSNVDLEKSTLLAKLYKSYVNEEIDWNQFCEMSDVISRAFISDLKVLDDVYRNRITDTTQCEVYRADRLISLGLLDSATKSMSIGNQARSKTDRYINVNAFGKKFCKICMN